jgi:hypothetical protein
MLDLRAVDGVIPFALEPKERRFISDRLHCEAVGDPLKRRADC